jgi:DNA-binding NarL/FixJ family response regulator
MGSYTVLIVDDHELFSTSLRIALRAHDIEAHNVTPDSYDTVITRAGELTPGLVVLDLDLGKGSDGKWLHGSQLVAALRELGWQALVVSGSTDLPGTAAAVAAGAVGVVPKSSSFETLLNTVLRATTGQSVMTEVEYQQWLASDRSHRAQERELSQKLGRLSRREREVLELLAEGHRAAAIADRFVVSMTTIRTQVRSILVKLEVNSQLEAVAFLRQKPRDRA